MDIVNEDVKKNRWRTNAPLSGRPPLQPNTRDVIPAGIELTEVNFPGDSANDVRVSRSDFEGTPRAMEFWVVNRLHLVEPTVTQIAFEE
jgi:hypothetical protein